jgi:hypothetical protein
MFTTIHYGRPSFTISNDTVQVFISVQGGHLTGIFKHSGREIFPYFVGPWWNEAPVEDIDPIIQVMRGDYFCFPFGANVEKYNGLNYAIHGKTANNCWDFIEFQSMDDEKSIGLVMDLHPVQGKVEKRIRIRSGQPIIYTNHIVRGFKGKSPLGNHPNIQCPDSTGSAILDMTEPVTGFTAPTPIDIPENQGYSLLKPGVEIKNRSKIPTVYGDYADLSKYPMPKGYEDVVMFISDDSKEFTFTSLTIPEEEFLYFQLKDPKVLSETLLWMPHGGRHYSPFNGRVTGVIGVEEVTGNFFYGIQPSIQNNPILERGFNTFCEIDSQKPFEVKLISGLIPVGKGFKGVKDIVKKNSKTVLIIGRGGEEIEIPCNVDFLRG